MKNIRLIILVFLFFLGKTLHGQPHYFRHYQVEEGLSNNAVICSLQDKKGFLWFGTKDGLNRFDGYTFKIFRYDETDPTSIGSNFIHSLFEDSSGTLWVGTEQGLYKYNAEKETFSHLKNTPLVEIREIKMDRQHKLWFIAGLTLYSYNTHSKELTIYPPANYFQATSICITTTNQIWVSTPDGFLKKYDSDHDSFISFNVFQHSEPPVSRWIEKLYDTGSGTLFVGTSNQGVKLFNLKTFLYEDILTYNEDNTTLFARDFTRYSTDVYWIATESGIYIYNLKTRQFENLQKRYNNPYSLSDNAVYTFCIDKEGGIWAGTYFGGLNYYARQYVTFEKFFPKVGENSLSGNAVREICPDQKGHLWIGTEDGGLNKLNLESGRFTVFKPDGTSSALSNTNIHGLLVTGDTLWIGTFEHGLDLMNIKTGKVIKHYAAGPSANELRSNFIYCIYQTHTGKIVLGTASGLYYYNQPDDNFISITAIPDLFYTSIFEDNEGTLWSGTYRNGLYYFNSRTRQKGHYAYDPDNKNSINNNRINCIFQDSYGSMWFATEGGICRLNTDNNKFERFTTKDGLPSNMVYSILEDEARNLWMSTSRGLARFSLLKEEFTTFTKANGLLSDQFNYNSAYKDSAGRIYFGNVKGLISFQPASFIKNTFTPPVYITDFYVYNKELKINDKNSALKKSVILTDSIVLKHNQSSFSINFAALSYTSPKTTEYAYKMEGLDQDWTYLKANRKAYFTKLSPGDYVFKVKASNSSGVWNKDETRLSIKVLPPFWKSSWAYLCYVLIISVATYYLVRGYHHWIKEKNRRKLESLEHQKEKEVYQAKIEFFTHVAHEIRTPLTLIIGPMEKVIRKSEAVPQIKNNLKIMERNTNRLLNLTNQLLDFRKTETKGFSLNFVKAKITVLLQDLYIRFKPAAEQKKLHFQLNQNLPDFYAYVDKEAFNKILSNLVDNAIKYAKNKVEISLFPPDKALKTFKIEVKNDGELIPEEGKEAVFEVFYRAKSSEKHRGTGIGLPLARSLAELHHGTLTLKEPEKGMTIFVLSLPMHHDIEFNPIMSR